MTEHVPLGEFKAWPKIPRYSPILVHISEKIDGTNACVIVKEVETVNGGWAVPHEKALHVGQLHDGRMLEVLAASRTRFITPESDNFGFAAWVKERAEELTQLGIGRHYGEWYGAGIQRRYGLDHKRFALFNALRVEPIVTCCEVVPTLYFGEYSDEAVRDCEGSLRVVGSLAVPGWMQPEGIVVRLLGDKHLQKITDLSPGAKKVAA